MAFLLSARRAARRLALTACVMVSLGQQSIAGAAEKDELSQARAKFQQATEMEQAGNFANALQVFREVGQVRMTPQVRFHIATCEEKLGKLVAALGGYELALSEAESLGPEFQREVEARASALRSRIPKLVIERGEGAKATTIELDGVSLGASSIGVEVPLDPGPHAIQAKAPGHKQFSSTVEIAEGEVKRITVELEPVAPDAADAEPGEPAPAGPAPGPRHTLALPIGIGTVAASAAGWITTGVLYVLQRNKESELQALCGTDTNCMNADPRPLTREEGAKARSLNDTMHSYNNAVIIGAVSSAVLTVTGGAMIALDLLVLSKPKPTTQPTTAWAVLPSAPGAELGGMSLVKKF